MTLSPYTYTILRYVHDVATEEFVNVGVVLASPQQRFFGARLRSRTGRVSGMFRGFDGHHFRRVIEHLRGRLESVSRQAGGLPLGNPPRDARAMALRVLGDDDSAFQWSPMGSGVSPDLAKTLDRTYARFVTRHARTPSSESRSDAEIWKAFRLALREARRRLPDLRPRTISTDDDQIEFQHAWKNGKWHCLEPLSFDLQQSRGIQDKAHRWLGVLTSVGEAAYGVRVLFLVGKPQRDDLVDAYQRALRILAKAPVDHQIFEEHQMSGLLESIPRVLPGDAQ